MSAIATSAPARASVSASARPSPREPPVTSATRPERSISRAMSARRVPQTRELAIRPFDVLVVTAFAAPGDDGAPFRRRFGRAPETLEQERAAVVPADRPAICGQGALPGVERLGVAAGRRQQLTELLEEEGIVGDEPEAVVNRPRRLLPAARGDVGLRETAMCEEVVGRLRKPELVEHDGVVRLAEGGVGGHELVMRLRE